MKRTKSLYTRIILLIVCLATLIWACLYFTASEKLIKLNSYPPMLYDVNKVDLPTLGFLQNINVKVLNPQSPAYGMEFTKRYGFPTETEKLQNYREVYSDWRPYLPNLVSSIRKQKRMNSAKDVITKTVSISINTKKFAVGDTFEATLTSLDEEGKRKKFGGDYFRVRLFRGFGDRPAAIPCRITDNNDGTYTIKSFLLFEGLLMLNVVLVSPLEGILEMIKETEKMLCDDRGYIALLKSKEKVVCSASYKCLQGKPICDFSSPQNNATWVCERPPSKSCGPIVDMFHNHEYEALHERLQRVCNSYGCHVQIKNNIAIEVMKNDEFEYNSYWTRLPYCKELFEKNEPNSNKRNSLLITGFGKDSVWNSLVCRNKEPLRSWDSFQKCLKDKVIYYLGDSTVRHFYFLTAEKMKLKNIEIRKDQRAWQQSKVAYDTKSKNNNITLYFRCHGTPMQNPGPPDSRPFIADTISNIPVGGRDVFVVLNLGSHFYRFEPSMFIQRLQGIRRAIIRHHAKFPETKFIIKGLNVAFNDFLCWEWTIYRLEQILKTVFIDMSNVAYVNLWDFTTAWPSNDIHPGGETLVQQWFLLHSLMCA